MLKSESKETFNKHVEETKLNSYKFIDKWKNRDDYLKNPKILLQALEEYEEWTSNYGPDGNIGYYYWLKSSLNKTDPKIKAKLNQITDFATKISNDIQFFTMRIAKIPQIHQKTFLKYPQLNKYKHFLENLFDEAKYLLTEDQEKIINLKGPMSYSNWVKMTSSLLSKEEMIILAEDGKKSKKNFSEILGLIDNQKKEIRDSAAKAFNKIQEKYVEIAEHEINSILQDKKIEDELRGFKRPDSERHNSDDIKTEVVDALIKAVSNRFDISKDYYKLKAKLMKVNKLKYHERNVPYGTIEKDYKYSECVDLIDKVLVKIDKEFSNTFKIFREEKRIDVYPQKGKSSGAFCVHGTIKQPTYILLNYTNKLRDVSTLAHELGHGINNEMIKKKQNGLNFGTPTSTAEVASTFIEDFVFDEILKNSNDETKLSIMMSKLNDDISTIFRQIACYKFELELHTKFREKGYLSKDEIGKIFQKHMESYMGTAVEQTKGSKNWWVYWKHIRSYFYVYSYASGLLISKSLQNSYKKDPKYINKIKDFMSAGLCKSPADIFLSLNINISNQDFWKKGLDEVSKLLEDTEQLAIKLGKIKSK